MILLIISIALMVFGVFVYFKKNEGETEIDLLGAKLKSNNSAILLISLGAVFGLIWALRTAPVDDGSENGPNSELHKPRVTNSRVPVDHQSESAATTDNYTKIGSCTQLSNMIDALKTGYSELKGTSMGSRNDGAQRYRSNYTIADFPSFIETSPDGTDAFVQIDIVKGGNESYTGMQELYYAYIENCLLKFWKLPASTFIDGNLYKGRKYKVDDDTYIEILLQESAAAQSNLSPLLMRIYHFS